MFCIFFHGSSQLEQLIHGSLRRELREKVTIKPSANQRKARKWGLFLGSLPGPYVQYSWLLAGWLGLPGWLAGLAGLPELAGWAGWAGWLAQEGLMAAAELNN